MRFYFIANARMPSEKAHGIHIAKMCEAFVEAGVTVTLVVPRRGRASSVKEFYGLRTEVRVVRLPSLGPCYRMGQLGFVLATSVFVVSSCVYLLFMRLRGEQFVAYSVDMDTFSFVPMVLLPCDVYVEMHTPKPPNALTRFFFHRARVIATNPLIADDLSRTFDIKRDRLLVEPNGVDESLLCPVLSKQEARRRLVLPQDKPFVLYIGRFYGWKELGILSLAAGQSPLPLAVVGGTREEFERVTGMSGTGVEFFGERPVQDIPLWLAAAEVLLVLGSTKNESSYRYTTPMKVYEYFAARRPVVASRTAALQSFIPNGAVTWYEPDNPRSLCEAIRTARDAGVETAAAEARVHTWRARAERILSFMQKHDD